jgi:hypothetical protein
VGWPRWLFGRLCIAACPKRVPPAQSQPDAFPQGANSDVNPAGDFHRFEPIGTIDLARQCATAYGPSRRTERGAGSSRVKQHIVAQGLVIEQRFDTEGHCHAIPRMILTQPDTTAAACSATGLSLRVLSCCPGDRALGVTISPTRLARAVRRPSPALGSVYRIGKSSVTSKERSQMSRRYETVAETLRPFEIESFLSKDHDWNDPLGKEPITGIDLGIIQRAIGSSDMASRVSLAGSLCRHLLDARRREKSGQTHEIGRGAVLAPAKIELLAVHMLWACRQSDQAPPEELVILFVLLHNLDDRSNRQIKDRRQWNEVATQLALFPNASDRETARLVGVAANTVKSWRRDAGFAARVESIRTGLQHGGRPVWIPRKADDDWYRAANDAQRSLMDAWERDRERLAWE